MYIYTYIYIYIYIYIYANIPRNAIVTLSHPRSGDSGDISLYIYNIYRERVITMKKMHI